MYICVFLLFLSFFVLFFLLRLFHKFFKYLTRFVCQIYNDFLYIFIACSWGILILFFLLRILNNILLRYMWGFSFWSCIRLEYNLRAKQKLNLNFHSRFRFFLLFVGRNSNWRSKTEFPDGEYQVCFSPKQKYDLLYYNWLISGILILVVA